ncbi:uncharacterized protein LOC130751529 [Actinidia eriantha]|uniref:uncharacterized protein LOC130751529 n=1 Tax=Actinidia eriantha TaxID=165200 RepID=UPI00258E430E|nr:uncharacterized protein LOC130751529 [Actinidia eriantha]
MLTAGWNLWPFAHLITYGVIPVEQRLLWVTILSTYSNEKSEARLSNTPAEMNSSSPSIGPPEVMDMLQSRLGVGRKSHHRLLCLRIGGVNALLRISLCAPHLLDLFLGTGIS